MLSCPYSPEFKELDGNCQLKHCSPPESRELFYLMGIFRIQSWASKVAQTVKSLPGMWETRVGSQGWKDPLEKEMETHSRVQFWRIP